MTFLKGYVFTLCTMMVLFALTLTAVPETETKKTLRIAIGIVAALIMVSPLLGYEGLTLDISFPERENLVDLDMAEKTQRQTIKAVETEIESRLEMSLGKKCMVNISPEGLIEKVEIVNGTQQDKEFLKEAFGINPQAIILH